MKSIRFMVAPLLLAAFVLVGFTGPGEKETKVTSYKIDKAHTSVGFKVRHLGITSVNGTFNDYDVTLSMDGDDLRTIQTEAVVRITSVDTGIEKRDNHLRSSDFFEAETYPEMRFVSKEVRNIDGQEFELVGDLTIKGVTREVVLDAELIGTATMGDTERVGFEAETKIDRFDYGLKWDRLTEAGGLVVAKEVRIILEIEAIKQQGS